MPSESCQVSYERFRARVRNESIRYIMKLAISECRRRVTSITRRMGPTFGCLIVCFTLSTFLLQPALALTQPHQNRTSNEASIQNGNANKTATSTRARISLESKSFDLDDDEQFRKLLDPKETEADQNPNDSTTIPSSSKLKGEQSNNKRKSSRRLSNIWSMFLPGSSEGDTIDYENEEGAESVDGVASTSDLVASNNSSSSTSRTRVSSSNLLKNDDHNERLVAKLAKSSLNNRQNEPLQISASSGQQVRSSLLWPVSSTQKPANNDTTTSPDQRDLQPVRLITGALSNNPSDATTSGSLPPPNMNEIVSNIMSSLGTTNNKPSGEREFVSTIEHDLDQDVDLTSGNKTAASTESTSFERWLNRIKGASSSSLHQPLDSNDGLERERSKPMTSTTTTQSPPSLQSIKFTRQRQSATEMQHQTSTTNKAQAAANQIARQNTKTAHESNSHDQVGASKWLPDVQQKLDLDSGRPHEAPSRLQSPSGGKGFPKRATLGHFPPSNQQQPQTQMQQQQQQQGSNQQRLKYQSHPFQQQMRQQQAQLIHGIKYPHMQASTISVSTQDGASNTSLAFGGHYIPQINPINAGTSQLETSQVANSNTSQTSAALNNHNVFGSGQLSLNSTSGELSVGLNQAEQSPSDSANVNSAYQSQDEILRQVTSAINFEQQQQLLNQQKRSNGEHEIQHQQQPDLQGSKLDQAETNYMTPDGASRLLKSTASTESISNQTNTAPNSPLENMLKAIGSFNNQAASGQNQPSQTMGSGDIDKSFDLLADKVRQLASRQQNLQQHHNQQQQLLLNASQLLQNQSQQLAQSQQPSWLRAQQQLASLSGSNLETLLRQSNGSNLVNILASLPNGQEQQQPMDLEQMRDLLLKHEKTKNELKSSQESMIALMRQMMQLKAGDGSPTYQNQTSLQNSSSLDQSDDEFTGLNENQMVNLMTGNGADMPLVGSAQQEPPTEVSNAGWMPLDKRHQHRPALLSQAPLSPANQMKGRVRFPSTGQQLPQQHVLMRPQQHSTTNNIGLMFANSPSHQVDLDQTNELDQRIIGLPIALLNNDEMELSHQQLEDAARLAAEQLGAIPPSGGAGQSREASLMKHLQNRQQHANNNPKFVPRVAPSNQVAQNRLHPQEHLSHVQKLLHGSSPQTFAQMMMTMNPGQAQQLQHKLAATQASQTEDDQQQQLQQHEKNLMQLEKLASLLPPLSSDGVSLERPSSQAIDQTSNQSTGDKHTMQSQDQNNTTSKSNPNQSSNNNSGSNSSGMRVYQSQIKQQQQLQQRRQQQQKQSMETLPPQRQQLIIPVGQYGQIPGPGSESLTREFRPLLDSSHFLPLGMQPQVQRPLPARQLYDEGTPTPPTGYTTISGGGPPMKLHELTLRRPFGFRGHHAITYQASPAVAAMFPRFMARPPGVAPVSRPGILRHMTPIRATLNEGQRIIAQMLPPPLADHVDQYQQQSRFQHQYPTHTTMGQTLPIPPMRHLHPIRRTTAQTDKLHHRRQQSPWLRHLNTIASNTNNKQQQHFISSSRVRVRHMEPEEEIEFVPDDDGNAQAHQLVLEQLIDETPPTTTTLDQQKLVHVPTYNLPRHARLRPGRQMFHSQVANKLHKYRATEGSRGNESSILNQVERLRIDKPSHPIAQQLCLSTTTTTTSLPPAATSTSSSAGIGPETSSRKSSSVAAAAATTASILTTNTSNASSETSANEQTTTSSPELVSTRNSSSIA